MIFHASIPADDPARVARVIAELWRGSVFPFVYPESLIVVADDDRGTEVEVMKRGIEQVPAATDVGVRLNATPSAYSEVHLNILSPLSQEEVLAIGKREGWIARRCDRFFFKLIELWLENKFMVEVMTEAEAARYKAFMHSRNLRNSVGSPPPENPYGFTDDWLTAPPTGRE